jgi:acetyl-CoA C-acetyltransferase
MTEGGSVPDAVIVAAARSPIGRAGKGSLKEIRADDLAAQIIRAALDQVPALDADEIEDLYLGCGLPGGEQGFNLARVVAVLLGHDQMPGATVTRYCASSVQTTRMAFHAIRAGEGQAYISAGVECVSGYSRGNSDRLPPDLAAHGSEWRNPRFAKARARSARRSGAGTPDWTDPRDVGDLPDVYIAMGQTAENVASAHGITRRLQDEFAARSQNRAEQARASGFWAQDITPVTTPDGTLIGRDDGPRSGVTVDSLAALAPVFRPDGTITAGNCCPMNDGAAALVLMSDQRARELGLRPLARILSTGVSGLSPEIMGLGPVDASRLALVRAGMTIDDIDLVEINEAFAAQVIPSARELGVDAERLNVNGGGIAVGHPYGMTGARLTTTMINSLRHRDCSTGLVTMCVGGGQGMALVLERLS